MILQPSRETPRLDEFSFMVVDDSIVVRTVIKWLLRSCHAREIREAADGAHARTVFKSFAPDIVLVDWEMQPVDGLDFVKHARHLEDSPDPYVGVIIMSSRRRCRRALVARDAGVDAFVTKPISPRRSARRHPVGHRQSPSLHPVRHLFRARPPPRPARPRRTRETRRSRSFTASGRRPGRPGRGLARPAPGFVARHRLARHRLARHRAPRDRRRSALSVRRRAGYARGSASRRSAPCSTPRPCAGCRRPPTG